MSEEEKKALRRAATAAGGIKAEVERADGSKEEVFARQLAIKEYPAFAGVMGDEEGQLEMVCGEPGQPRPKGWAQGLRPASHNTLMEISDAINGEDFFPWFARLAKRVEALKPGAIDRLLGELTKTAMASASTGGSRTSRANAG